MNLFQKILTGVMLLLTGVLLGMIIMIWRDGVNRNESVQVRVTDVKRSVGPVEPLAETVVGIPGFGLKDVAREVLPTVVYIESSVNIARRAMPDDENHNLDENFWERIFPQRRANTIGSGVIISPDGYILTNNHVVAGARNDRVLVTLHDKRNFEAAIVGRDPQTDLAVIKVDGEDLPHSIIGNSDLLEIGDWVMAVGNPLRLRSTVTAGIVSALGRNVQIISDRMSIEHFIQTDAAINKGNSGGALVNMAGELIGINTAIATENGGNQGYGFAIPINMAFKIGRDLIEFGAVQRAFLGVQIVSVDDRRARQLGLNEIAGVEIVELVPDGSADRAGLRVNDVVLEVDEFPVGESNDLQARIALRRPGETTRLKVWRNGRVLEQELELFGMDNESISRWAQQMDVPPADLDVDTEFESQSFDLGFTVAELARPDDLSSFELVITAVTRGSEAARRGLRANDVIVGVDNQVVSDLAEFRSRFERSLADDNRVVLGVRRGEDTIAYYELRKRQG
jgi:serine protease Do